MLFPSLAVAKTFRAAYKTVPICLNIFNRKSPLEVLRILKAADRHCFILESAEDIKTWGRYTFLGFDPVLEFGCINGRITISDKNNGQTVIDSGDPSAYIRKILADNLSPDIPNLPPFTGGLVGYFAYDYIKYGEPTLHLNARDEEFFKDVDLMLFDKVIVFDNLTQKTTLIVSVRLDDIEKEYKRGRAELKRIERLIERGKRATVETLRLKTPFKYLFSKEQYVEKVKKIKRHIIDGDIFQLVLSNRLDAEIEGSLLSPYRTLRTLNPSPYMFYFSSDKIEIMGASPETLVKLCDGKLYTFPLAGTMPRGKTEAEDLELEKRLLSDEKELAEHNMLVDLGRNDIGKISKIGSVRVERYKTVERFSHVMHIGSTVTGQILPDKDAMDAIEAILPAGTLSGAPKIRACQIINDVEDNKRGIYGGAIGYIDFKGNLDMCIAIRIAFSKNGRVFVRSGAGIVADSVPENEYAECLNKARAVVDALEGDAGRIKEGRNGAVSGAPGGDAGSEASVRGKEQNTRGKETQK